MSARAALVLALAAALAAPALAGFDWNAVTNKAAMQTGDVRFCFGGRGGRGRGGVGAGRGAGVSGHICARRPARGPRASVGGHGAPIGMKRGSSEPRGGLKGLLSPAPAAAGTRRPPLDA